MLSILFSKVFPMTSRERWLAALNFEPVDCIPFWPKIDGAYLRCHGAALGAKSALEIQRLLGSDAHAGVAAPFCGRRVKTRVEWKPAENGVTNILYETPHGNMTARHVFDEPSCASHPAEFPIKTREDILRMTSVYEDTEVCYDADANEKSIARCAELGETASTMAGIGESPLMEFVEWLAGVENAHFFLADYPDETQALFDAMHRVLRRKVEIAADTSPADTLLLSENTSTTLISPGQYRALNKPMLVEYADICRGAGRRLVLHMCGHLKALLPDLAEVGATAFEAFTSPTVGNTTLLDGRLACPDVCLIGGTNAALWMRDNAPAIIAQLEHDIAELPHRRGIVISSAGVMPALCSPETIRRVCEWVHGIA